MNVNNIEYKISTIGDTANVTLLLKQYHGDTTNITPESFILAKFNNQIIGCVRVKEYAEDNVLELASLVVLPEFRKQGIGSQLVQLLLKKYLQRPIYLLCQQEKEKFYRINGFTSMLINHLPKVLYNDYLRVIEKMPEIKENVIAMKII